MALALLVLGHPAPEAGAQSLPQLATPTPTETPSGEARGDLRSDLERLLQQLEDPEKARQLAVGLRALLEAGDAGVTASGVETPGGAAAEEATGADQIREAVKRARPAAAELLTQIEDNLRERLALVRQALEQIYQTAESAPEVLLWTGASLDEPEEWQRVVSEAGTLIAILGSALLAMWLASRALARARNALAFRDQDQLLSRVIMAAGLVLLRAIPILVFALIANGLVLALAPDRVTVIVLSSGVAAIVAVRIGVVLAQAVLSPTAAPARLVPLSDDAARSLMRYGHWFLALAIYGETLVAVLRWYGLPWALEGTLTRLIALTLLVSAVWIVIKRRRPVADLIAGLATDANGTNWSRMPWRRLGAVWHVFTILYLFAMFVIYTIQGEAMFLSALTGSTLSLAVLVGLMVALRYVERTGAELAEVEGHVDEEADADGAAPAEPQPRPQSFLSLVLRLAILLAAVFAFLQVWGLGAWDWLFLTSGEVGENLLDIGMIAAITYATWLVINRFISGYIKRLDDSAAKLRSSNRTRTALVLARNALLVTLYLIAGLVILSELGVNIAPLLAGAGVLGIAIGFGSQRLVQDVITGLFNLLEDTFAVGDVVDLGGKSGVVEAVTIRTVRLRDLGGNVHMIPFGAIDVVTNMTKDFAFAVFEIGVAYREDVDEVMRVISDVGDDMQEERAHRRLILEPLEMLGVDRFADSAVVIKCRLKVRAGSQWMLGREFRRRLKNRFDELGIEIPFPHQTLYFGADRRGQAPPARVVVGAGDAAFGDRGGARSGPRREGVLAESA